MLETKGNRLPRIKPSSETQHRYPVAVVQELHRGDGQSPSHLRITLSFPFHSKTCSGISAAELAAAQQRSAAKLEPHVLRSMWHDPLHFSSSSEMGTLVVRFGACTLSLILLQLIVSLEAAVTIEWYRTAQNTSDRLSPQQPLSFGADFPSDAALNIDRYVNRIVSCCKEASFNLMPQTI